MHDMDTRNRFVELRGKGISLARCATRLKVSRRTLVDWNQQEQQSIRALRAVELEALHEKIFLGRQHEMYQLRNQLKRIEQEMDKKSYEFVSAMDLYRLAAMIRTEIRKTCEPDDVVAAAVSGDKGQGSGGGSQGTGGRRQATRGREQGAGIRRQFRIKTEGVETKAEV